MNITNAMVWLMIGVIIIQMFVIIMEIKIRQKHEQLKKDLIKNHPELKGKI